MIDFVEAKSKYMTVEHNTPEKAHFVFEALMEVISPEDSRKEFEVNGLYYAKQLGEFIGGTIPAACLTALVKRGLLHCDGKSEGKNYYAITNEIYDYYKSVYLPTKEEYMKKMITRFWD